MNKHVFWFSCHFQRRLGVLLCTCRVIWSEVSLNFAMSRFGTPIHINVQMTPIAQWVKVILDFSLLLGGISVSKTCHNSNKISSCAFISTLLSSCCEEADMKTALNLQSIAKTYFSYHKFKVFSRSISDMYYIVVLKDILP